MDLIIRNARLFDGSGGPSTIADVAVRSGTIAAIGNSLAETGVREVDADGLCLMPGIIDSHTHYDAQISWDPTLAPSSSLGVTSVVIGNCGFTIAPCRADDRELIMRNLTQVEGMSIDVLRQGINWNFESFPDYLEALAGGGMMVNVAAFMGHSSIRSYVMGADAVSRPANSNELAQMCRIVEQGMAAGAIGFASSTAPQHNGHGGSPMPSRLADDLELEELVSAMGKGGQGLFMLTKGGQTSIAFLEKLAAKSQRPVLIAALLHNSTKPDATFNDLAAIGEARARGHELWGQISCCPLTNDFTFKSAYPLEGLDAWKPAMQVEGDALKILLMDDGFRARVKDELAMPVGVRLFNNEWDKLELIEASLAANRGLEGKTVDRLAADAGREPLDWILDFAVSEDLESLFTAVLLNSDETAVGRMIRDPNALVSLSDAGAHLTFFCDAGFGLHLMGHWSRDLGVLSLEQAVHELTAKPAAIYRIPNRGRIGVGYHADLLLFDAATVARGPKRRVHDLPGGAPRLTTDAVGIHGTWVNGVQIADQNGLTDGAGLPGQLLREFEN
ncbi:MAG: amidohydrolase family protein [Rhodospirillales bacterium]|nr:amidohydrolase family protein [Rhodospirillales bacterium]